MADKELLTEHDDDPQASGSQQEELVAVETPPGAGGDAGTDRGAVGTEDARPRGDTDDEGESAELAAAANDAEREAIRERRRKEKAERKLRRDEAIKRDKLELDFLRKRNDDLERRLSGVEQQVQTARVQTVDARLRDTLSEIELAEQVLAKAVQAGNGEDVTKALRARDAAMDRARQLQAAKQQAAQPVAQDNGIDDATLHHARSFLAENKWYDPQGRDEDSAIVLAIDAALVRDGYDPRSADYWDELRRRAARRLPERFAAGRKPRDEDDGDDGDRQERRAPRGGPAMGSGREHVPATSRREVYISPERKAALIEAGVWDDPVLRQRYLRRYAEYDRNSANRA